MLNVVFRGVWRKLGVEMEIRQCTGKSFVIDLRSSTVYLIVTTFMARSRRRVLGRPGVPGQVVPDAWG